MKRFTATLAILMMTLLPIAPITSNAFARGDQSGAIDGDQPPGRPPSGAIGSIGSDAASTGNSAVSPMTNTGATNPKFFKYWNRDRGGSASRSSSNSAAAPSRSLAAPNRDAR